MNQLQSFMGLSFIIVILCLYTLMDPVWHLRVLLLELVRVYSGDLVAQIM